jgi:ABC-type proline/glycine betaine transport system ATPase subunit
LFRRLIPAINPTVSRIALQDQLHSITQNRTTIIIAHRLSTVVNADTILVVKNGIIIERGSHEELLAQPSSIYKDMWLNQLRDSQATTASKILTNARLSMTQTIEELLDPTECAVREKQLHNGTSVPHAKEGFSTLNKSKFHLGASKSDINLFDNYDGSQDDMDDEEFQEDREDQVDGGETLIRTLGHGSSLNPMRVFEQIPESPSTAPRPQN